MDDSMHLFPDCHIEACLGVAYIDNNWQISEWKSWSRRIAIQHNYTQSHTFRGFDRRDLQRARSQDH